MVFFAVVLSLELTVPETELLELSTSLIVLVFKVELSIASLKVTDKFEIEAIAPFEGEVDATVGAVVSSLKAYDSKAGMVAEMPRLL